MRALTTAALAVGLALAQDPADSWLAYTVAKGNGKLVTQVNMTWAVPAYPTTRDGGNAPGWWFGIEPEPAMDLIQPILAYGDGQSEYTAFNGEFDWHDGGWFQSPGFTVQPGAVLFASVTYDQSSNSYIMDIQNQNATGQRVRSKRPIKYSEVYTDVYVVTEHQPNSCSEYPANGGITFYDISIAWENVVSADPNWQAFQYQPACNSQAHVVSPSEVSFSWDTSDAVAVKAVGGGGRALRA